MKWLIFLIKGVKVSKPRKTICAQNVIQPLVSKNNINSKISVQITIIIKNDLP